MIVLRFAIGVAVSVVLTPGAYAQPYIGYKAMHVSQACLRPSLLAVWDYATDLKTRGVQAEIELEKRVLKHPLGALNDFAGFPKFREWEAKYLPSEEVAKKYDGASGL